MAKIDDSVKKKVPELRFPGFTYDWEERKLKDVVEKQIKGKAQFEKLAPGEVEYLDTSRLNGGQAILTNGLKDVTLDDILILWDGSKAGTVYHGFEGALGSTLKAYRTSANSKFVYQYLKRHQDNIYNNYRTPNIPHVQKDFLNVFTISVPVSDEQEKIGSFFKELDDTIALHQRKLDLLKEQKKGYLQKMFPKNGAKVPELRFAGFADDWELRKLGDVVGEIQSGNRLPKDSLTNGDVPYVVAQTKNDGVFTKIARGTLDYNGKPMKLFPGNSISFSIDNPEAMFYRNAEFYTSNIMRVIHEDHLTHEQYVFILENMKRFIRGYDWSRKFSGPVVSNLEYLQPSEEEQQKIGSFFKQLDDTIALHQRKLDLLKEQKKGYLQKMFV